MPDISAFTKQFEELQAQRKLADAEIPKHNKMRADYRREVARICGELRLKPGDPGKFFQTTLSDGTRRLIKFIREDDGDYTASWVVLNN